MLLFRVVALATCPLPWFSAGVLLIIDGLK